MHQSLKKVFRFAMPFLQASLIKQILVGFVLGCIVGLAAPEFAHAAGFLGTVFVTALKGVAPVLVFVLVMSSIASRRELGAGVHIKPIIVIYLLANFCAALVAVALSFMLPSQINLISAESAVATPGGIGEVLRSLMLNLVDNPFHALANANYIGILAWSIAMGIVLRKGSRETHNVLQDASRAVEFIVAIVIRFAPFGIFGLVADLLATSGLSALVSYGHLLAVLVGAMLFVALVVNPFIVWFCTHDNPYPLTFMTLQKSGISAFFTRSSAANIPVNLAICKQLGLPEATYAVSIPVGATVNMGGAAVTITVLTLSAAYSLGITVDLPTALFLCVVSTVCAAGTSGVPGGSIMLIPLACGLFGIDANTAMQVVAVGFVIGVVQDSCETALNSSSDVLFTAAACKRAERIARENQA